ncbi:CRISPR system Cascade subunit CasA [Actinomadura hallensis]|uniref:CRISPR system Cascade subunit CasA n=1 Tax=Actinomadura hallensis TaxID=337895 RepID=A0A543I8J0_9ACTN|nr:type I-E CRISPR-associated protein Cse1/CasA [Actinomadura hallensis]TQM66875.1 CRISPR system Cascade subunit CasA [Actinomadura hallensis]
MNSFNLVDDPWLRLRCAETGEITEVGIADALLNAGSYGELVVDLPTQLPAIMRQVLLPIVLDALGSPADSKEWARRFAQGRFDERERNELGAYLETHRQRFDLFDPAAPFAQVGDLRTSKGETKGSALLVATAATGNNVPLFASRTEADPLPLTPAEAARWLVHAHCWDTAAIKTGVVGDPKAKGGKTTGNPTGPLGQLGVVMPIGRTLYDTLLLNLPIGVGGWLGTPQWKRTLGPEWEIRAVDGLLDLWTWQSRRIRLVPEDTDEGPRVTRVIVAAGDRLSVIPDKEPHTAWRANNPSTKIGRKTTTSSPLRPLRHTPGKAIWRGLNALLAVSGNEHVRGFETSELLDQLGGLAAEGLFDERYPLRVETFGMLYGNQSAVVEDVLHDLTPLPVAALRANADVHEFVLDAVDQAEQLAQAVNRLSDDLRRAAGLDPIPWDKAQRPGERVLHALDPAVRRLLHGLQNSTDADVVERAQEAWEITAVRATMQVADSVYASVPENIFAGREYKTDNGTNTSFGLGHAFHTFYDRIDNVLPFAQKERRKVASTTISGRPSMKRRYWDRVDEDGGWLPFDPTIKEFGPPPGEDLALMRRGLDTRAYELWEMCRFYTFKVDDDEARRGRVSREQEAEHAALALYGLHQQSKRTSMHRPGIGLGVALRRLRNHGKFSADAIDARVTAAATTIDPDALLLRLRGLVDLLRTIDQPLDYERLMWLIYDWHYEDRRRRARRRWALEYQVWNRQQDSDAPADSTDPEAMAS